MSVIQSELDRKGQLTPDELAELKRLEAEATQEPWTDEKPKRDASGFPAGVIVAATAPGQAIYANPPSGTYPAADRRFIFEFRNHAKSLIAAAEENAAWQETARQYCRNTEFYRGLVEMIGEQFGDAAKTSDDGSLQQSVLALKVPELVASLRDELDRLIHDNAKLVQNGCDLATENAALRARLEQAEAQLAQAEAIIRRAYPEGTLTDEELK